MPISLQHPICDRLPMYPQAAHSCGSTQLSPWPGGRADLMFPFHLSKTSTQGFEIQTLGSHSLPWSPRAPSFRSLGADPLVICWFGLVCWCYLFESSSPAYKNNADFQPNPTRAKLNFWAGAGPGKSGVTATPLGMPMYGYAWGPCPERPTLSPPLSSWVPCTTSTSTLLLTPGDRQPSHLQIPFLRGDSWRLKSRPHTKSAKYHTCHINFVAYGVIFPPKATKRKFRKKLSGCKERTIGPW